MKGALKLIGIIGMLVYIFAPLFVEYSALEQVKLGHTWIVSVLFLLWAELLEVKEKLK